MKIRMIASFLVLAIGASWALRDEDMPRPEAAEASPVLGAPEPLPNVRPDLHATNDVDRSPAASPLHPLAPATPLARQRDRLHDTAARLAVHLQHARVEGAPEVTVRALETHLERVEHQLAALGVDVPLGATAADTTASRALFSPGSGS